MNNRQKNSIKPDIYKINEQGRKDISGFSFGLMKVLFYYDTHSKAARWLCECACGNFRVVNGTDLRKGKVKSCGCLKSKHGLSGSRIHRIWKNMMSRTLWIHKDGLNYRRYKARGITVCEEWQTFEPFYKWAMVSGYEDHLTIDRIDNDGPYSPENCRWATRKEQSNNLSTNKLITFEGKTQTQTQWEEEKNLPRGILHNRIHKGRWSIDAAMNTPPQKHNPTTKKQESYSWLSYSGKIGNVMV
jgi:hypothetical protein